MDLPQCFFTVEEESNVLQADSSLPMDACLGQKSAVSHAPVLAGELQPRINQPAVNVQVSVRL